MRRLKETKQLELYPERTLPDSGIILNKARFIETLQYIRAQENLDAVRSKTRVLRTSVADPRQDTIGVTNISANGDSIPMRRDLLLAEIDQVLESQTVERARYYLERLEKGIGRIKTSKINEINLLRWKEYDDVITDSLWVLDKRDTSGAHWGGYWGNFIPQIPRQMMLRYTKRNDWVLDTFVGSGTTLIECKRLGRNGIGIELNPTVALTARELVAKEPNAYHTVADIVVGNSASLNLRDVLTERHVQRIQLIVMHPPYHDIIKFSDNPQDLSNAPTTDAFLEMFCRVVDNVTPWLEHNRYMVLVIGDKYSKGEWIPLGFYCMQQVLKRDYTLKSIVVKNFEETRGKRNQKELWRYRALVGGFYVFKHEYIFIFKKGK